MVSTATFHNLKVYFKIISSQVRVLNREGTWVREGCLLSPHKAVRCAENAQEKMSREFTLGVYLSLRFCASVRGGMGMGGKRRKEEKVASVLGAAPALAGPPERPFCKNTHISPCTLPPANTRIHIPLSQTIVQTHASYRRSDDTPRRCPRQYGDGAPAVCLRAWARVSGRGHAEVPTLTTSRVTFGICCPLVSLPPCGQRNERM